MRNVWIKSLGLFLAVLLLFPVSLSAQRSSSSNYSVDQTFFGSGGELNACSGSYCSKQSAGELGVGRTASGNYSALAGFNTTDEPFIEFVVTSANIDLGYLDTAQTKTATGNFYVRAWQSGGYTVRTESDPPTNASGGHQLTPLAAAAASSTGTEQFGMNLVANTVPTTFGANPQQVPDGTFSFGQVLGGYNTANQYKYVKGDSIAESTESSSVTIYTASYIFNIDNTTPSGLYTFNHVIVATGAY